MKIEIAEHGRMTESGSSLLRLIQNNNIPLLDLFVRESFQNSLDAAKKDAEFIEINLLVKDFDSYKLSSHFESIEDRLNALHSNKSQCIAILDKYTDGLIGPIRYSDVENNEFGNLLKLVYEISKHQCGEGSGGSWGLGKTVYFRLGIGLVIYYSRIKINDQYKSRLVACLVEDETKDDSLIPQSTGVRRGIAWWGDLDSTDPKSTIPLDENSHEIYDILAILGIQPYKDDETGTAVIIPYIDERRLLEEVYPTNEKCDRRPYWTKSLLDYLKVASQRWYAPRINNKHYNEYYNVAYLKVCTNDIPIETSSMLPTFGIIRDLYIFAICPNIEDGHFINRNDIQLQDIKLNTVLNDTKSGTLAFAKFSKTQLKMTPPNNETKPYQQIANIDEEDDDGNVPIIMFTRQPGMIVAYDYRGAWTHGMPKSARDIYVIGLFVLNSKNYLKQIDKLTLEEYIRQGEKADHASWTDRTINGINPKIIEKIQKGIIKKVKDEYVEKKSTDKNFSELALKLGSLLLPSEGFGSRATFNTQLNSNDSSIVSYDSQATNGGTNVNVRTSKIKSNKKGKITVTSRPIYNSQRTTISFEITLKGNQCLISLLVVTDLKKYDANVWEHELEKKFPLSISRVCISSIQQHNSNLKIPYENVFISADPNIKYIENEFISLEITESKIFNSLAYFIITSKKDLCTINGEIDFTFKDPMIKASLSYMEI